MADEERLIEEARRSREETARMRGETVPDEETVSEPAPGDSPPDEPWAKTSSGDAEDVTDDGA